MAFLVFINFVRTCCSFSSRNYNLFNQNICTLSTFNFDFRRAEIRHFKYAAISLRMRIAFYNKSGNRHVLLSFYKRASC